MDIITVIFDDKGHHRIATKGDKGDGYETIVAIWKDDVLVPLSKQFSSVSENAEHKHMAAIREVLEKNK